MKRFQSLKGPHKFRKVFKEGRKSESPHFVLYARENGLHVNEAGVSISKIHMKLATTRNRMRRIAKTTLRELSRNKEKTCDYVVASRKHCRKEERKAAEEELRALLRRSV